MQDRRFGRSGSQLDLSQRDHTCLSHSLFASSSVCVLLEGLPRGNRMTRSANVGSAREFAGCERFSRSGAVIVPAFSLASHRASQANRIERPPNVAWRPWNRSESLPDALRDPFREPSSGVSAPVTTRQGCLSRKIGLFLLVRTYFWKSVLICLDCTRNLSRSYRRLRLLWSQ